MSRHKSLKQLINLFGLKGCHDQHRIIVLMCLFFVVNVFFCMLCYIVTTMVKYLVIMITNVEIKFVTLGMFSSKASHSIGVVDGASHLSNFVQPGHNLAVIQITLRIYVWKRSLCSFILCTLASRSTSNGIDTQNMHACLNHYYYLHLLCLRHPIKIQMYNICSIMLTKWLQ